MPSSRSNIDRLEHVGSIRQTMASAAEARGREVESLVRTIELEEQRIARKIYDTRAEITYRAGMTGQDIQQNEKYVEVLKKQRLMVLQRLEKAKAALQERHNEWIEARREHKIVERLQERRLLEWQRQEDIALQKSADEAFIGRLVRARKT